MEITKTLHIPAAYFYDKIIDSVLFDIRKQTGKSLNKAQLQGFEYKKNFGGGRDATVKITQNILDRSYHYQTKSSRNNYEVKYDIFPIDAESSKIVYSENMESIGLMQQLNDMLTGLALGFLRRRNFKKMLTQIEESY